MYKIKKTFEVAGAHSLCLPYDSKCRDLHGHNWIISVYCMSKELNPSGMVIDFTTIKQVIHDVLDHKNLNDLFDFNPTAENIAYWVCCQISSCYQVDIQESTGNIATYVKEDL